MKKYSLFFLLMTLAVSALAQEKERSDLLITDSTWTKEVFPFPLSFAPEIPFEGFEEARFPKRWSDSTSAEHWSYVFAWDIKRQSEWTARELEDHLQSYFNGLMQWQHTNALLINTGNKNGIARYTGKIKTFDAFFSKK